MKTKAKTEIEPKTEKSIYEANLKRIVAESVFTSIGAGFSCATITVFWNSIGMNQTAIGFVQMIYTIVVLFLDIPMGYLADRFNRKIFNIVGDIGVAFTFLLYAISKNMYMAIIAESLLGVFNAMTNGVDNAFLRHTAEKINPEGKVFEKANARMHTMRYVMLLVVMLIGGFIAKYSLRLTIALSFIPYFIGTVIAFKIEDYGEKADVTQKETTNENESKNTNENAKKQGLIKGMISMVKGILKDSKTRIYMMCYILGNEVTHANVWVFTPLLLKVGVPVEMVSIGWILKQTMQIIGGKIAETKMIKCTVTKRFSIPMIIQFSWLLVLIVKTNIFTIWLFALSGFVHGLAVGTLVAPLQMNTDKKTQTCVMSIASTGAKLMYIPMVYFTNYLGNIKLQLALVGVLVVFLPMCILAYIMLRKTESKKAVNAK